MVRCRSLRASCVILPLPLLAVGLSCSTFKDPPLEYRQLSEQAFEALQLNDYETAREKFLKIVEKYPNQPLHAETQLLLASCELKLGNLEAARRLYVQIAESVDDPELRRQARFNLGTLELQRGEYGAAADVFRVVLKEEKDAERQLVLKYKLATALHRNGSFQEAGRYYRSIIDNNPSSEIAANARHRLNLPDYFTVQVGAYKKKENAERQSRSLQTKGFPATVDTVKEEQFHYVRVGQFEKRAQAAQMRKRLIDSKLLPSQTELIVIP